MAKFIPCRYFYKLQWKHFPKEGKGSLAGPQQHLFVSSGIAINLCEAKQCKPLAMCMLLNWIKKFQLPLNGPNLPSSSPFGLHGTSGRTGVFVLVRFACPFNKNKAATKLNAEMQPTKWMQYSWLVACRYKTHGSNDKSQKFTRRLLFPFHQMMFCELRPSHFRQSQKLKQVKWAVYRQESKAEQTEKFCMGSFFAQFVVWYTRVAYFIFALKAAIRCVRPLLIFDTRYFKSQLLLQMT